MPQKGQRQRSEEPSRQSGNLERAVSELWSHQLQKSYRAQNELGIEYSSTSSTQEAEAGLRVLGLDSDIPLPKNPSIMKHHLKL